MSVPTPQYGTDRSRLGLRDDRRYRDLIDHLQERVVVYRVVRDSKNRVVDWVIEDGNPASMRSFGRPRHEIIGQSALTLFGSEVMQPYLERCRRLDASRNVERFETFFDHDQHHYRTTVFFLSDDFYVTIAEDITQRKRDEAQKRELEQRLLQAQKLEELGRIAGGIAHDFNNVLQPILGHVELLLARSAMGDKDRDSLRVIRDAALRGSEITSEVLAFAREEALEATVEALPPIVTEAVAMVRATLPSSIEIIEDIDPRTPPARVSPTGMHRVLVNLLVNAGHAIGPRPGQIRVSAGHGPKPGSVCLRVEDTGSGIPEADIPHIFDPFFSRKGTSKGTGLGLAVVQGTVAGFGGEIRVESQVGVGTTFEICLPVAGDAPRRKEGPVSARSERHKRILLVDDDRLITSVLRRLLESHGHSVMPFQDPREALSSFRAHPDAFDLVISDMNMPAMHGGELAAQIRKVRANTPVIVCSGYHEGRGRDELSQAGVGAVLKKPVSVTDLLATIDGFT